MTDPSDRANERIEAALAQLGAEHEPPAGWEARVLAATQAPSHRPWWRSWWTVAVPGLVLAAAAVLVVPRMVAAPAPLALAVEFTNDAVHRGGDTPGIATLGDIAHIVVTGGGEPRALWIYHGETLLLQCPGAPECRITAHAIAVDVAVKRVGDYRFIALPQAAVPAPTGSYDADLAALQRARIEYRERKWTVP